MHTGGVPDQNKEQCGREQKLKNMFKRNQVMITALAIMIAVAGYLNFAGTKVGEEELADVRGVCRAGIGHGSIVGAFG